MRLGGQVARRHGGVRELLARRGGQAPERGVEEGAGYSLQIRSKCDWGTGGGEAVPIKCYLTRLWFDEVDQNNGQHLVAGVSNREQNGTGRTRPS